MFKSAAYRGILYLAFMGIGLQASSIVVGQPPVLGTGNCDPFGCPAFFGLGTYQQVYLSSAFPGAINIEALTFFDVQVQNSGQPAGGTFTVSLSYSSNAPGALNITNPNTNIATGFQTFFSGSLPALQDIGNGGRQMSLNGVPFTYDPAGGNLLVTVTVSNPADGSAWLYLDQAATVAQTSNAYFGTYRGLPVAGGNDIGGLITQFNYTPVSSVPEPGSLLLVLAGTALIGHKWRRCGSV
jgi:hypothetical protein